MHNINFSFGTSSRKFVTQEMMSACFSETDDVVVFLDSGVPSASHSYSVGSVKVGDFDFSTGGALLRAILPEAAGLFVTVSMTF